MTKVDLTKFGVNELSFVVMNTEFLYNIRHSESFLNVLDAEYIFTEDQYHCLVEDLSIMEEIE